MDATDNYKYGNKTPSTITTGKRIAASLIFILAVIVIALISAVILFLETSYFYKMKKSTGLCAAGIK